MKKSRLLKFVESHKDSLLDGAESVAIATYVHTHQFQNIWLSEYKIEINIMVLLQVYTKCIKTKYKVRLLSKGTLVFILTSVLCIVVPFILAYKSKGEQGNI